MRLLWCKVVLDIVNAEPIHTQKGIDYSIGLYYWYYYNGIIPFASRQENNIIYSNWRYNFGFDVPWNVFYAYNSSLSVVFLNNSAGKIQGDSVGTYQNSFWPRDLLSSRCRYMGSVVLENQFGGKFHDGMTTDEYACNLEQNLQVQISPLVFVANSTIVRFQLQKPAPGWNPQVWDIMDQLILPDLQEQYMRPPSWLSKDR